MTNEKTTEFLELTSTCNGKILKNCNIGIWRTKVHLEDHVFEMYIDDVMTKLLGIKTNLSPTEVYNHWFSRVDTQDVPYLQRTMANMLATGLHHELELLWRHPEQGLVHIRCGGTSHISEDKTYAYFEGFFKIMQEVRQMQSTLRESFEHVKTIFDATPMGAALCDPNFNLVDVNPAQLVLFELESSDDLAHNILSYCPEFQPCGTASTVLADKYLKKVSADGQAIFEWLYVTSKLNPLPVEVTMQSIKVGTEDMVLVFSRDLREQKAMLAELSAQHKELQNALYNAKEASRSKNLFFANISHEIRTPMNAILGMSYLCLQQAKDDHIRHYIENIQVAGKNLLNIINDVLDISKIEAGKLELESRSFSLNNLLESLRGTVCTLVGEKPVEVLFNVDPNLPESFEGDSIRLGQVLTNLFSNANKFTESGHLLLHVYLDDRHGNLYTIGMDVVDTGIGMDSARLEAIFRPFEQEDQTTTRRFGGTGLGLTISKNIVELMGGELKVSSELGKGTTFSFTVNLFSKEKCTWLDKTLISDEKILIVDDNDMACKVLQEMLKLSGFHSDSVKTTQEACDLLKAADEENAPYKLVIVDWNMPDMDGYTSAATMRDLKLSLVPVFILTSAYTTKLMEQKSNIFSSFIPKPVLPIPLWTAVMNGLHIPIDLKEEIEIVEDFSQYEVLKGRHVLLAEDNEINQEIATALLEDLGMIVHLAENGQQALDLCKGSTHFDVVLMDIQMPIMDGFVATRKIRTLPHRTIADLPIVAMTAHAMQMHKDQSIKSGMNDHIAKPIDPKILRETLLRWLDE